MPVNQIMLSASQNTEIMLARAEDLPLFQIWKERFKPENGVRIWQPLTQSIIDRETLPQQFSDMLDHDEAIERQWIHTPCWKLKKDAPNFEQAYKEVYAIFNVYTATDNVSDSRKQKLIALGYPANMVNEVPPMKNDTYSTEDYDF
jgi:hypothetical protein